MAEAGGHDDNRALYGAPIFKPEPKVVALMLDGGHIRFVDVRHGPILEPLGIVDERLDRYRIPLLIRGRVQEASEPILLTRIGKVCGPPVRTQEHPPRHVPAPKLQGFAEDSRA